MFLGVLVLPVLLSLDRARLAVSHWWSYPLSTVCRVTRRKKSSTNQIVRAACMSPVRHKPGHKNLQAITASLCYECVLTAEGHHRPVSTATAGQLKTF